MKSFLKFNFNVSNLNYDRSNSIFINVMGLGGVFVLISSFHDDDDGDDNDDGEKYIYNLAHTNLAR